MPLFARGCRRETVRAEPVEALGKHFDRPVPRAAGRLSANAGAGRRDDGLRAHFDRLSANGYGRLSANG
jgi:hypothetical protein